MKKLLLIIVFIIGINSTFGKGAISKILFIYAQPEVCTPVAIPCSLDGFGWLNDILSKSINDSTFISEFTPLFEELTQDAKRSFIDARIMAIISYYNDERQDTLCFGEYGGIDLNGTFMMDHDSLLNLVKKEVWNENKDSVIYKLPSFQHWTHEKIQEFLKISNSN